ncbi:hypothetical protein HPB48_021766 [Haemaphysalis longicornis]|uniref:Uncharacterized protein n=1 Tax=Haemaphysalis longicornis TaxID=44386 RepID=A0A9J6G522_HAELO|nr:hypothetical protein HPB48_021766 [Haemaphysalis longicornis]
MEAPQDCLRISKTILRNSVQVLSPFLHVTQFLRKPNVAPDVVPDDFGSRVSLRTLAPTAPDAASIRATATPLRLAPMFTTRPVVHGHHGWYQGPLSQWQIAADMYIDSDIRRRGRRRLVGRQGGEAAAPLAPVEHPVQRRPPAEPCPRREELDREMGIPRRRLVLKGVPLHASSYSHWYSRVFSPLSSSNEDC